MCREYTWGFAWKWSDADYPNCWRLANASGRPKPRSKTARTRYRNWINIRHFSAHFNIIKCQRNMELFFSAAACRYIVMTLNHNSIYILTCFFPRIHSHILHLLTYKTTTKTMKLFFTFLYTVFTLCNWRWLDEAAY